MNRSLAAAALLFFSSAVLAQVREPTPAFKGQTEAPPPAQESKYRVETVTDALTGPWAVAFLPDGNYLVTERRGALRTVSRDGKLSEPIAGVPSVKVVAAQSFHEVVLDPSFAQNRYVYFTYFAPPKAKQRASGPSSISTTRSGTSRSPSGARWTSVKKPSPARSSRPTTAGSRTSRY